MKKLLSVFLAIIMIFSCCTVAVNALYLETTVDTEYVDDLRPAEFSRTYDNLLYSDIIGDKGLYTPSDLQRLYGVSKLEDLIGQDFIDVVTKSKPVESDVKVGSFSKLDSYGRPTEEKETLSFYTITTRQLEVLGVPVSYMYKDANGPFLWANLNSHPEDFVKKDADGNRITLSNITKADISLLFGDFNMYLLRVLKMLYSDFRFYTDANAIKCINFIGDLFYKNFNKYDVKNSTVFTERDYIYSSGNTRYADEEIFFQRVADLSGLSDLIQVNWVDYGTVASNFKPLLKLLGVTDETLLESEYYRGDKIAPAILETIFTKVMGEGPLNYFLSVFEPLIKGYHTTYITPLRLLFTQKMSYYDTDGKLIETSEEEFATITGLLNLIVNGNRKGNKNYFQFAPLPEARLAVASDKAEFYLMLLVYFNVNAHYLGNKQQLTTNLVNKINALPISNAATTDKAGNPVPGYKTRLIGIIKALSGDSIETMFYDNTLTYLTVETLSNKPSEYYGNVKEAVARMIKRIADWFQMWIDIFTGELEFGAGAFE